MDNPLLLDSGSVWDFFKAIGDALAKSVAGNVFLAAIVLVVLIVFVAAVASKQQVLYVSAAVTGGVAIILVGALSFGASLPIWYAAVLLVVALVAVAGAIFALIRGRAKPKPLDQAVISAVTTALSEAADEVAGFLGVARHSVRANVFAPAGANLRIVPALTVRMNDPRELTLEIPVGKGVVGTAWKLCRPIPARFDPGALHGGKPWLLLPPAQAAKVNRDLRWVVAMPTPPGKPTFAWAIDGLEDATDDKVDATVPKLAKWGYALDAYLSGVKLT